MSIKGTMQKKKHIKCDAQKCLAMAIIRVTVLYYTHRNSEQRVTGENSQRDRDIHVLSWLHTDHAEKQ